jgi:Berberine and berberine like
MTHTRDWLSAMKAALEPYDAGRYLNFSEERFEMTKAFQPATVDRLRGVKQRYDPEDIFQSNHPVTG